MSTTAGLDACPWADLDAEPPLDLDDFPMSILTRVASVLQQEISRPYARAHGLSLAEWRLLARLATSAPMPLSSLCKVSSFDKAQASRVLRALEARDLVALRASEHHKRRVIVDVTATGSALAEKLFPIARRSQRELLARLTEDERRALYSALRKWLAAGGAAA